MVLPFFGKKPAIKVLFVATEAAPFVKAGGLGEVMFSLPRALSKIGYDVRLVIPRYAGINLEQFKLEMELEALPVPTDAEKDTEPKDLICNVRKFAAGQLPRSPVTTYFLENMEYYEQRANVYGYADDAARWALLCRGTLEFLRRSGWRPDIIVCSDWQTGFLPNYLKTVYKNDPTLSKIATVFAIHNLFFQGMFDHRFVSETDFDDGHSAIGSFFNPRLLKLNGMRRGILGADLITTVSPNYAREIMTPEYGEGLDGLLRERRSRVHGVINAIDYKVFNPETNPNLAEHYNADKLEKRAKNKSELQKRFNLKPEPGRFLASIVARLREQKGFDLLFPVLENLLKELKFQLIVVGDGEAKYMGFFQDLEKRYPSQAAANLVFDKDLPHLVYAGSDAILIPSKFEPSGLTQMEAMRYGCVPIVRKTGGLADTVEDYDPVNNSGIGFVFENFDSMSLVIAVTRAFENYRNPRIWHDLQKRAMEKDFSWKHSAEEYGRLFELAKSFVKKEE
jgi:starch synthase